MKEAVIHFDGASHGNPGPAGGGALVTYGDASYPCLAPIGRATNNVAEYAGLIVGLEKAASLGARRIRIRGDSQLVIRQLEGRYKVSAPGLQESFRQAKALLARFDAVAFEWIPRHLNAEADALATQAAQRQA